jgi:lysophospholipase L1-like esterase/dienelactone hydrolase
MSRRLIAPLVLTLTLCVAARAALGAPAPRDVTISASDGVLLKGTYFAAGKPGPGVLLLHMCNTDRRSWEPLATELSDAGVNTLTLDYRGFGESAGPRFDTLGAIAAQQMVNGTWPKDVDKAYEFLLAQPGVDKARIGVGGGSCGVTQALMTAKRHPDVRTLVLLAGPPSADGRRFLMKNSWLPVFTAAAADDQFDHDAPQMMKWLSELNGNPRNKFVGFPDGRHGTEIFKPHPELPREITAWYVNTLVTHPANPRVTIAADATPAREFWTLVDAGNVARAIDFYHATHQRNPAAYLFPEAALNLAGYEALQKKRTNDAIALFTLNTEAFPASANAQDSLGDGYRDAGDKDRAVRAAEKALALLATDRIDDRLKQGIRESAEEKIAALGPGSASRFELPATDDGLPGAGPIRRFDWFKQTWKERRTAWAASRDADQGSVVFVGDSITQGWDADLPKAFPGMKIANRGINGDTSRGVLIRLRDDVLAVHPSAVVVLIGTNDIEEGATPDVIAGNLKLIVAALEQHERNMPIVLCEVFPSSATKKRSADQIKALNAAYLAAVKGDTRITVLDTWRLFADANGDAPASEFPDLLHPNEAGYAKWAAALRPAFATLGLIETSAESFTPDPGFESLFNGHDLTGWGYRPTSETDRANAKKWQASDPNAAAWPFVDQAEKFDGMTSTFDGRFRAIAGRLVVTTPAEGRKIQQLWTTKEFGDDFVLKLQFRATPNADSGVYLRGPQLQCRDYLLAGPYTELKHYKPQDWNDLVVTVHNGVALATCNGEVLESDFKLPASGPIGLEGDRGQMEYRHIQIQRLALTAAATTTPDLDRLREFATKYAAAWCSGNPLSVAAFYAPKGSLKVNDEAPALGRPAITAVAQGFMTALPDMKVQMDSLEIEGGRPVFRWTFTGTNTGAGGTGRAVHISGYEEWRLDDQGLITESRGHFDAAEYLRQLDGRAK